MPDWATSAAVTVAALSLLGLLIRQIGPWRKQITDEEAMFRATLIAENKELRRRIEKIERALRKKDARHNAERALDRHKHGNLIACLDAAILLLEMNPERALEVVVKIKDMRARQMVAEAEEAAIIYAADIADAEAEDDAGKEEAEL